MLLKNNCSRENENNIRIKNEKNIYLIYILLQEYFSFSTVTKH